MSKNKAKGTRLETLATGYYATQLGLPVERRAPAGNLDRGDIAGIPGICIEVKNHKTMQLAGWIDEAIREAAHENDLPAVYHKRRGKGQPEDQYVTMPAWAHAQLLRAWIQHIRCCGNVDK